MSVRILYDSSAGAAALYCSSSGWAFGPVIRDADGVPAPDLALEWLAWLRERGTDPRLLSDADLERAYVTWRDARHVEEA
jgi:hypothetical protein